MLRNLIVIALIFICSLTSDAQIVRSYKIELNGVVSRAHAKGVTDFMRNLFSSYPFYNETTCAFVFNSSVNITEEEFKRKMLEVGYLVVSFNNETFYLKKEVDR